MTEPRFPDTLGDIVGDWIEEHCRHGPGDLLGQRVVLLPSERVFLRKAYRLDPFTGRRKVHRATRSRRKGFRKTEFMAWICIAEAVGPVRARLDADGHPTAVQVTSPLVLCTATTEDQADETVYGALIEIVKVSPTLLELLDPGQKVTNLRHRQGSIESRAMNPDALDGGKPTFQAIEEPHLWTSTRLWSCHKTLTRNLKKRPIAEPWLMEATTAHQPGAGSVAEAHHEYGLAVAAGEIEDETIVYDHLEASQEWDLRDPEQLRKAIIEASGDVTWTDVETLVQHFNDPDVTEEEFRRFWLNQSVSAKNTFATKEQWAARAAAGENAPRPLADGDRIVAAFDGSRYSDSTALIGIRIADGYAEALRVWEKPDGAALDWEVDEGDVDAAVDVMFARFRVLRFACDPPYWSKQVAEWQRKYSDTIVRAFFTSRPILMGPAIESTQEALRTGALQHQPDSASAEAAALGQHARNARLIKDRGHWRLAKPRGDAARKIDGAVTLCIAWDARMRLFASGADIDEELPVYESHFGTGRPSDAPPSGVHSGAGRHPGSGGRTVASRNNGGVRVL